MSATAAVDPRDVPVGATARPDGRTDVLVWAPLPERVELVVEPGPGERVEPLAVALVDGRDEGWRHARVDGLGPGTRYRLRLHRDGEVVDRPDPASRWQPDGVHGPSAVDDPGFAWTDHAWRPGPLHRQVLYELHVGTFTDAGTFDGVVERLPELADLGVTLLELLPVAQFPGGRNWGYDGVLPFAVQDTYGGPDGLRRLVDAAHGHGLGVVLDVVYNHFGPEGNHLPEFGPYLTDRHGTPWGGALNADGPGSDAVRRHVVENAARWVRDFHLDGLRLDAVHAIVDQSARHLLAEVAAAVRAEAAAQGRRAFVIAESDLNDPRLVRDPAVGGHGLDAMWADDFHHAVHALLTGERDAWYADFGEPVQLAEVLRERHLFTGRWSTHRGRTHGASARDLPHQHFVTCVQNHDQVGNRMLGERLASLVEPSALRLAAALLLLAPHTPMLFMGEEHGEVNPFLYFTSHTEPELATAVRDGRRAEFAAFAWKGEAPDPQDPDTFARSRLDWSRRDVGRHARLLDLHRHLLRVRREVAALADPAATEPAVELLADGAVLAWRRELAGRAAVVVANLRDEPVDVDVGLPPGPVVVAIDTADPRWDGPGGTHLGPSVATGGASGVATIHLPRHAALCLHTGER